MGIWGLDIFEDDLAADVKEEFERYLMEGMEEVEAIEELLATNDNLLDDIQDMGTFVLTLGTIAKDYQISSSKITKLLKSLNRNKAYWEYLAEESEELCDARRDLLRELL